MTIASVQQKTVDMKNAAVNNKSRLQDMFARLSSKIMAAGKWDDEFNRLIADISMEITASTQNIEEQAVIIAADMAKMK